MLQAAGLLHVTASVRIVCVKKSNKRKQTALDLGQKIAIINEIEGGQKQAAVAVAYGLLKQTVNSICMLLLCCLMA